MHKHLSEWQSRSTCSLALACQPSQGSASDPWLRVAAACQTFHTSQCGMPWLPDLWAGQHRSGAHLESRQARQPRHVGLQPRQGAPVRLVHRAYGEACQLRRDDVGRPVVQRGTGELHGAQCRHRRVIRHDVSAREAGDLQIKIQRDQRQLVQLVLIRLRIQLTHESVLPV